jgi:tRNA 2-thiouridine synthesizing protein A
MLFITPWSIRKKKEIITASVSRKNIKQIFCTAKIKRDKKEEIMSELDFSTIEAASMVDARGSACPGPLLEAKKGIGKVKVGEILEIFSNDSGTRSDVPAWAKKVGHEYLGFLETDGYDKHYVRRKK